MESKVTVLTCVYNGLPYLKGAIESTLSQTYADFEYLIIDDCSSDLDVVKFIESYDDPRIRFIKNEENLGVSNTINKALSLIRTPYVIRLDQDDVNLPNRVSEQISYLEKHPEISIVCSWEHTIDSNGNKIRDWKRTLDNYGDFLGYVLLGLCPIWHPSIAFRTTDMVQAGGFKVGYTRAEDFEVTTRLALKRYGAAVVSDFHLLQREHDSRQSIQFKDKQVAITKNIHNEALIFFSTHPDIGNLAGFLRLEKNKDGVRFDQKYLKRMDDVLEELFLKIFEKQKLSFSEFKSLKKIIYKRIGFGMRLAPILVRLPAFLFYPCYYMLSPLQIPNVRKILSKTYNNFAGLRYIFK